ncbi:MAG: acyltransferase [Chryseobacterium jejuense]|uniref:acyltransferase n=1 Tax=Chryseobacterium jejuense TaxID=445960 RepID=UPI003D1059EA
MNYKIHNLADVQTDKIGDNTMIWQFCVVLKNATIGNNCNINCNVFIENDVIIGNNVTIKPGVQVWDGVTLEDNVFIGPNVTFTNDLIPRSKQYPLEFSKTLVKKGASIGANSTIIAGNIIGENSLIGAGSVVTKDIPAHTVWFGNPARHTGYITLEGTILDLNMVDKEGISYQFQNHELLKK